MHQGMHTKFLYSYSESSIQPHPTACFSKRRPRVCLRSSQYLLHSMLMISSEGETSKGSGGQINLCMSVGTWPARETVQYTDIAPWISRLQKHIIGCEIMDYHSSTSSRDWGCSRPHICMSSAPFRCT